METLILIKSENKSIVPECFRAENLANTENGTYIILIEHGLPRSNCDLIEGKGDYLNQEQLLFINQRLDELALKKLRKQTEEQATRILKSTVEPRNIADSNDNNNRSSELSTSSSMENWRNNFDECFDKSIIVREWLNKSKIIIRKQIIYLFS
jgi:hypothetical protein